MPILGTALTKFLGQMLKLERQDRSHLPPTYKDHPLLPAKVGNTRARILKKIPKTVDAAVETHGHLWDSIATVLYLVGERSYPWALEQFFDPAVNSFKFEKKHVNGYSCVIWREADEVLCGLFEPGEDLTVRALLTSHSKMSKVGPDAEWNICWDVREGTITKKQFEELCPSSIKASDFIITHEFSGNVESGVGFGSSVLIETAWKARPREVCQVEVDKILKATWKGREEIGVMER